MSNNPDVRHILVVEDQKSKRIVALRDNTYSLGRDPGSSIVIYDRQVSRHHATLLRVTDYQNHQDFYRVIDGNLQGKKSTNGIMINGKYSLSHELRPGDTIRFGSKAKATYQLVSQSTEMELLEKNEEGENLPESISNNPLESEAFDSFADEDASKNTVLFPVSEEDSSLSRLRPPAIAEFSPHPIIELTTKGEITYLNPAASLQFSGLRLGKNTHPLLAGLTEQTNSHEGTSFVREVEFEDNYFEQHIYYVASYHLIRCYLFEITKYKKLESKYSQNNDYYQFLFEQTTEGILLADVDSKRIIETNQAYCKLLGYPAVDLLQKDIYQVIALDREVIDNQLNSIEPEKPFYVEESLHRCQDGTIVNVEEKITRSTFQNREIFCFTVRDISERKRSEERLQYQAFHDPLTNLPNRLFFNKELSIALANAQRNQNLLAVMFLDLDSFKNINNTLGHSIGDQVLQSFARRLTACVRGGDTVARWGSDEFTILLPRIRNTEDTIKLASRIFDTLKQPFIVEQHYLQLKTSIGIAVYPQDGEDKDILLRNADVALCRTKEQGRNHYQFYTPHLSEEAELFLKLETLLHQALEKQEFTLHYQPQIKISSGEVTGIETFLRWQHPRLGAIAPSKFLPLAEKTDLILTIGKWVLTNACQQALIWQKDGFKPVPICVNLSNPEFAQPNLVASVARILEKTGLDPQWLELEITEKTLRQNLHSARQIFQDFQNLGVRIALDDFGTGYSALGYLKQFSFRTLKLDQTFIRDLRGSSQEKAIISAAIALSTGFNFRIVAEAVETQQQVDFLHSLGCEEAQGYHYSRPLSAEATRQFLDSHRILMTVGD
jgi:diguanylate cyclase (GGDEF)-like protein/PAS domain S-box-containing protein